jgi:hypothetical protein
VTSGEDAVVVDVPGAPSAPEVLVRVEHGASAIRARAEDVVAGRNPG